LVVDDRAFRPDKLIAEEQGLLAVLGLDLEQPAPRQGQAPDHAGDLPDDGALDQLMPANP